MTPDRIEAELRDFKTRMLIARPFYGDILLRIPVIRDDSVETACTDGRMIKWNAGFFGGLTGPQRNYVLMHEVFHTLLMHPARLQNKDPEIWNVAVDIIVNHMCDALMYDLRKTGESQLMLERPPVGIFAQIDQNETAENLYGIIMSDNRKSKVLLLRASYAPYASEKQRALTAVKMPPRDLVRRRLTQEEREALEQAMHALLRDAASHARGTGESFYMPRELNVLLHKATINWKTLLREYLSEAQSDDTSYATPERKYLHMDLILPGHGLSDDGELESVWAFVDSSGSISQNDLNAFLRQLYQLVREFKCEMNIAYWDTSVTDVYKKITEEKDVLNAKPKHSGGTDINCVYRWVRENKVRPLVSVILTDGFFGIPDKMLSKALPAQDTILVLCNNSENPVYKQVGKIARL